MKLNKLKKFAELLPEYITVSKAESKRALGTAEYVRWQFPNKYGASLVCHSMTNDQPEFAVLYEDCICYDSGVTRDVIGYTTVSEVALYLAKLRGL
jgi:hypothetical protein